MYIEETEVGQTTVVCALNASWGNDRLGRKRGCGTLKGIRAWFKEDEMKTKEKEPVRNGARGKKAAKERVVIGREMAEGASRRWKKSGTLRDERKWQTEKT